MAGHESILHSESLGLMAMEPGRAVESVRETTDLLSRARGGDLAAVEQLIRRHERQVFRTALRLLRKVEDAEDAAQEVHLRFYKNLRRLKLNHDVMPWLYRVTVNVCRDLNRRRERSAATSLDIAERPDLEPRDLAPGPYQQTADAEEWRMMSRALAALPDNQRASIVLRDLEGLPEKAVADILGVSQTTVRTHVCRARLRLREVRQRLLGENT